MIIMKAIIFLLMILLVFPTASYVHDLVWPGEKLKLLYEHAVSFEQKNLYLSDVQRAEIEKALGSELPEEDLQPSIYLAVVKSSPDAPPKKAAAIMFIDAFGKGGKIEMGVVVGGKGELSEVQIFENNEAENLGQHSFLKQFKGKKGTDPFQTGVDVISPAGQERSAQAIASGAKRGLLIINEVFRKK